MKCICGNELQYRIQSDQTDHEVFSIESRCHCCGRTSEVAISSEINDTYERIADKLTSISQMRQVEDIKPVLDIVMLGIVRDALSLRAEPVVCSTDQTATKKRKLKQLRGITSWVFRCGRN